MMSLFSFILIALFLLLVANAFWRYRYVLLALLGIVLVWFVFKNIILFLSLAILLGGMYFGLKADVTVQSDQESEKESYTYHSEEAEEQADSYHYYEEKETVNQKSESRWDSQDPYVILGVDYGTPFEEIKKQYKCLSKQYHPDLNPNSSDMIMKKINWAWDEVRF